MSTQGTDEVDRSFSDAGARVGTWSVGFHGGLTRTDLDEFVGVSVRDIALGRRSLGAGSLDALTDLASNDTSRVEPTQTDGRLHVGVNGSTIHAREALVATQSLGIVDGGTHAAATSTDTAGATDAGPLLDAVIAPSRSDGSVGAPVPSRRSTDRPRGHSTSGAAIDPDEDLEAYIERRLEDATFIFLPNRGRGYAAAKRTFDLVGAIALLLLATPVMIVLAIIIRIDSPGPALFRQTRVTRGGRTFRFYKFRTMYVDAKERFPELYAYRFTDSQFDDAFYKLADDPRNTRFGRWLRRTTLDELPNLINVLLGDLSLVGPRPELPELVPHYKPEELACFFTKAGLTGLAQVAGRSLLTVRERLTLDVRYVAHQTLLLDLRILWRTVLVVVAGRGAF